MRSTDKAAIARLEACLKAPFASPWRPKPKPTPPPPEREVHPEGTCEDCGATENSDGSELQEADGWVVRALRCNECHMMHRPGGY